MFFEQKGIPPIDVIDMGKILILSSCRTLLYESQIKLLVLIFVLFVHFLNFDLDGATAPRLNAAFGDWKHTHLL